MRPIVKQSEPASLTRHRAKPHADYHNYTEKDELRVSLVVEQGSLCCYCMQRIQPDGRRMKIEHWLSQEDHADRCLDYGNLLGACLGGHGNPIRHQHCDTRKGHRSLRRNPARLAPPVDRDIHYLADGTIRSGDTRFDRELNDVLNLNLQRLKNNRRAVLDGLRQWAGQHGRLRKATVQGELTKRQTIKGGDLQEYVQIAVYWLNKRLARG